MQAVIKSGCSQYLVSPGQEISVDKLDAQDSVITFSEVLLYSDGDKTLVGTPHLSGYSVTAELLGEAKGEKVRVFKYKAKSRYRRHVGFRAKYSRLKISVINTPETITPAVKTAKSASPLVKTETVKKPVRKPAKT